MPVTEYHRPRKIIFSVTITYYYLMEYHKMSIYKLKIFKLLQ